MLNNLLRNSRLAKHMSLSDLTETLNKRYTTTFTKSALQRYETGADIPANRLFILANYFNWSLDTLATAYAQNSRR